MGGIHEVPNTGYQKPGKKGWAFEMRYFSETGSIYLGLTNPNLVNKTRREILGESEIGVKTDKEGRLVGIMMSYSLERKRKVFGWMSRMQFNQDSIVQDFEKLLKSLSKEAYNLYMDSRNPKS